MFSWMYNVLLDVLCSLGCIMFSWMYYVLLDVLCSLGLNIVLRLRGPQCA